MAKYNVKYRIGSSNATRKLELSGGSESEAIDRLKRSSTVPKDANVIVLSIDKA